MRKDKIWKVYVHTNKINGKTYVGITKTDPSARWKEGKGYRTQLFFRAIKKYGWDNFRHEIVAENLTKEAAEELEHNLIIILKSKITENGYNVADGGNSSKVKTKGVYQFDCYGDLINKFEDVHEAEYFTGIKYYSIAGVCRKDHQSAGGYIWRYADDCKNLKQVKKEILNHPRAHNLFPIYQFDYDGNFIKEYANAREINVTTEFESTPIVNCCKGELVHTQGFCWAFKKDVPDVNKFKSRAKNTNKTKEYTHVVQLDLEGNYIATYISAAEAARATNSSSSSINRCVNHQRQSYKNYQWIAEKEYKSLKEPLILKRNLASNAIPFYLLDEDNRIIQKFDSGSQFVKYTGISKGVFEDIMNKGRINDTGFNFCRVSDYKAS